jgi:hypothetical protein
MAGEKMAAHLGERTMVVQPVVLVYSGSFSYYYVIQFESFVS